MSESLYKITEGIMKLGAILEDLEGSDLNDEDLAEALAEAMEQAEGDLDTKLRGVVAMVRNWEATAGMIKAEEQRLATRRKAMK